MYNLPIDHASKDSFCIIMIPDSQRYVIQDSNYDLKLKCINSQIDWIMRNRDILNIKFVTHVGDIVNDDDCEQQYKDAFMVLNRLSGVVPYGLCAGNHDIDENGKAGYLKKYFSEHIGKYRFDWVGSFDDNKNNAQRFDVGEKKYLFIHLEFLPTDGAIDWADKIIKKHSDHYVFITTHSFLITDWSEKGIVRKESRVSLTDCRLHKAGTNAGVDIFNKLIINNTNVKMVFNGHYCGDYYMEINIDERTVYAIQADYECCMPFGGNGLFRIIQFVPCENKIYNFTYSPFLDLYKLGEFSSFELEMN